MGAQFTPGPWLQLPDYGARADTILIGVGPYDTIAEVRAGNDLRDDEHPANARLIAAAPTLLTTLESIIDLLPADEAVRVSAVCRKARGL